MIKKPSTYSVIALTLMLVGVALLSYLLKDSGGEIKKTLDSIPKEQRFKQSNQSMPSVKHSTNQQQKSKVVEPEGLTASAPGNTITIQMKAAIDSFNLPEKLLKPAAETKISRVPRARLTTDNLEMLNFINSRRIQKSLDLLDTLPTRLNTEEVLQLTNAKRVSDGLEPLSEMPTGMPEVDENK